MSFCLRWFGRWSALKNGWVSSLNTRSQWISSETSVRLCLWQNSATCVTSFFVNDLPSGFCGLQRMKTFVFGVTASSMACQLKVYLPLVRV